MYYLCYHFLILSTINVLSIDLQSSSHGIFKYLHLIDATITEFQCLRSDEVFNNFYKEK